MSKMLFECSGSVNKPLPQALVLALPAIKANAVDLQAYAERLNAGLSDGEPAGEDRTNRVAWGNEPGYIWFDIELAIRMPVPQALQDRLPMIRSGFRQLKAYAVSTGMAAFRGRMHVCLHDEGKTCPDWTDI